MTPSVPRGKVPIEDRIDQLSRLALAIILIVTLALISLPKGQGRKSQESARKTEASRLVAKPSRGELREGLVSRPERRAKSI
jgi:hypothetical protein